MKYVKSMIVVLAGMTTSIMPMMPRSKSMVQPILFATQRCMSTTSDVQPGQLYQHFKGKHYEIVTVGRSSEDPAVQLVVYKALYDTPEFGKNSIWVRPYTMFTQTVMLDGQIIPRFKKVDRLPENVE
jgi:hypothetical protein